jgi:hypothetical protein
VRHTYLLPEKGRFSQSVVQGDFIALSSMSGANIPSPYFVFVELVLNYFQRELLLVS